MVIMGHRSFLGPQSDFRAFRFQQPLEPDAAAPGRFTHQFDGQARGLPVFPDIVLRRLIVEPDFVDSIFHPLAPDHHPAQDGHQDNQEADRDD
jgi:hypothetical protein